MADSVAAWFLLAAAGLGTVYTIVAALVFDRFFVAAAESPRRGDPVSLLKPLCGAEPSLEANLATFLAQDHRGPIQLICGVAHGGDDAVAAVRSLAAANPDHAVTLVIDDTRHGASDKVSNLANMDRYAVHPVVILSDSDMIAGPGYLAGVLAALDAPGVGAVTLLYGGRGDAGFWSRLGAAGLSYQFLPGAVFGVAMKLANPCMGSTIAIRRETLDRIGGFPRFADTLADDYAIGEAVRDLGLRVAVPPLLVTHASAERGLGDLWRHEVRWGATVRGLVPGAYAASAIGMPVPLALIGTALAPHLAGAILTCAALTARCAVVRTVDRRIGAPAAPLWLLPLRDCLTFAVFVASFFAGSVDWRGNRLRIRPGGRIAGHAESLT